MSLKQCPISDICVNYISGDNKPPNHHVRTSIPCVRFLDFSCELSVQIQTEAMGLVIACKARRVK